MPATGGSAVRVNDPATTEVAEIPRPAWSPDGSRLLYGGASGLGHFVLFSAPAIGGGETELSGAFPPGAGGVERATWSPDGSRIAYLADQETADRNELWVVAAAGGSPLRINPPIAPGGSVTRFAWSPDGTRLAYTADIEGNTVGELFVAAAVGGPSLRLNEDLVADGDVGLFEWSPDAKLIVYTADLTVDNLYEQRVVPAAGGAGWRVSPTDSRGDPLSSGGNERWSPDGGHLAFVVGGELYVTTTQGTELRKLSGTMVPGGRVSFARWSPDGSRIAYQADQDTDDLQELYMVGINGGGRSSSTSPSAPDSWEWTGTGSPGRRSETEASVPPGAANRRGPPPANRPSWRVWRGGSSQRLVVHLSRGGPKTKRLGCVVHSWCTPDQYSAGNRKGCSRAQ